MSATPHPEVHRLLTYTYVLCRVLPSLPAWHRTRVRRTWFVALSIRYHRRFGHSSDRSGSLGYPVMCPSVQAHARSPLSCCPIDLCLRVLPAGGRFVLLSLGLTRLCVPVDTSCPEADPQKPSAPGMWHYGMWHRPCPHLPHAIPLTDDAVVRSPLHIASLAAPRRLPPLMRDIPS